MAVKRNHLTENEGSQLMLQKDKEMVVKKKETQQGGGWGLGQVVIRKWDRHAMEMHVQVKEGRDLWWGPGWEIPKNIDISPSDHGIWEGKQAGQTQ